MTDDNKLTRRKLFKVTTGAAALVGAAASRPAFAAPGKDMSLPQVPRKVLGKTGKDVPILLFGAAVSLDKRFDPKMAEAFRFGVNYIDAAQIYNGGQCEAAVGNFWTRAKLKREDFWITSKSPEHEAEPLRKCLDVGLKDMKTKYVDLYFMHALQEETYLNGSMEKMAARLKKEGKIKHFGFSCHDGNVAELLHAAAQRPWIDVVMFRYDFSKYGDKKLNKAIDRAKKANVGLIAMKTQKSAVSFAAQYKKFEKTGKWNKHQAVLKAVWADERIDSVVSHMNSMQKLKENIAAALDKSKLTHAEQDALQRYADATKHLSCDGCQHHCNPAVDAPVQIGTTMRYLMYHDMYGEPEKAKRLFSELPEEARQIARVDYSKAAKACPNGLDVAGLMKRASEVLV